MGIMLFWSSVIFECVPFAGKAEIKLFFSFVSMSRLLPIGCADTGVHGAANWAAKIIWVNQTETLAPIPRLLFQGSVCFIDTIHRIALQTRTVMWELDEIEGLGIKDFCSWGVCAWKHVFKLVIICNNNMRLCFCPLEQEASYLNETTTFTFCNNTVNGSLLLMSRECSQATCTSGSAGLQTLHVAFSWCLFAPFSRFCVR